jgi:hypothetical protein
MLRGDSVIANRLAPLGFERAPLTFSVSLESLGGGRRSATMKNPSLSSYRDEIGQILGQALTGSIPARIAAEIDVPPGIAVAGVAFVAVLPEFVIEVYFAFSGHVDYVTASLTGSTRLLLSFAVGMPAVASLKPK